METNLSKDLVIHADISPSLTDGLISNFGQENRLSVINFKASAFMCDQTKASFNYEVKGTRALWDPSLSIPGTNRRGGWRCPPGLAYGGQITDRFGRNCGYGIARRIANAVSSVGERMEGADDNRRGRRLARRNVRMAERLAQDAVGGGRIERGARRVANALDGDVAETITPNNIPSIDVPKPVEDVAGFKPPSRPRKTWDRDEETPRLLELLDEIGNDIAGKQNPRYAEVVAELEYRGIEIPDGHGVSDEVADDRRELLLTPEEIDAALDDPEGDTLHRGWRELLKAFFTLDERNVLLTRWDIPVRFGPARRRGNIVMDVDADIPDPTDDVTDIVDGGRFDDIPLVDADVYPMPGEPAPTVTPVAPAVPAGDGEDGAPARPVAPVVPAPRKPRDLPASNGGGGRGRRLPDGRRDDRRPGRFPQELDNASAWEIWEELDRIEHRLQKASAMREVRDYMQRNFGTKKLEDLDRTQLEQLARWTRAKGRELMNTDVRDFMPDRDNWIDNMADDGGAALVAQMLINQGIAMDRFASQILDYRDGKTALIEEHGNAPRPAAFNESGGWRPFPGGNRPVLPQNWIDALDVAPLLDRGGVRGRGTEFDEIRLANNGERIQKITERDRQWNDFFNRVDDDTLAAVYLGVDDGEQMSMDMMPDAMPRIEEEMFRRGLSVDAEDYDTNFEVKLQGTRALEVFDLLFGKPKNVRDNGGVREKPWAGSDDRNLPFDERSLVSLQNELDEINTDMARQRDSLGEAFNPDKAQEVRKIALEALIDERDVGLRPSERLRVRQELDNLRNLEAPARPLERRRNPVDRPKPGRRLIQMLDEISDGENGRRNPRYAEVVAELEHRRIAIPEGHGTAADIAIRDTGLRPSEKRRVRREIANPGATRTGEQPRPIRPKRRRRRDASDVQAARTANRPVPRLVPDREINAVEADLESLHGSIPDERSMRNVRNRFRQRGLPDRADWRDDGADEIRKAEMDRRFGRYYNAEGVLNARGRFVNSRLAEDIQPPAQPQKPRVRVIAGKKGIPVEGFVREDYEELLNGAFPHSDQLEQRMTRLQEGLAHHQLLIANYLAQATVDIPDLEHQASMREASLTQQRAELRRLWDVAVAEKTLPSFAIAFANIHEANLAYSLDALAQKLLKERIEVLRALPEEPKEHSQWTRPDGVRVAFDVIKEFSRLEIENNPNNFGINDIRKREIRERVGKQIDALDNLLVQLNGMNPDDVIKLANDERDFGTEDLSIRVHTYKNRVEEEVQALRDVLESNKTAPPAAASPPSPVLPNNRRGQTRRWRKPSPKAAKRKANHDAKVGQVGPDGLPDLKAVPVGHKGIDSVDKAAEHVRSGGALADVPDDFLLASIGKATEGNNPRFTVRMVGGGSNEEFPLYTEVSTGRKFAVKYNGTAFQPSEDAAEIMGNNVAARLGFAVGEFRFAGPVVDAYTPDGDGRRLMDGASNAQVRPILFEWITNYMGGTQQRGDVNRHIENLPLNDMLRATLLDYLIINTDRHGGNWIAVKQRVNGAETIRFVPIDASLGFNNRKANMGNPFRDIGFLDDEQGFIKWMEHSYGGGRNQLRNVFRRKRNQGDISREQIIAEMDEILGELRDAERAHPLAQAAKDLVEAAGSGGTAGKRIHPDIEDGLPRRQRLLLGISTSRLYDLMFPPPASLRARRV